MCPCASARTTPSSASPRGDTGSTAGMCSLAEIFPDLQHHLMVVKVLPIGEPRHEQALRKGALEDNQVLFLACSCIYTEVMRKLMIVWLFSWFAPNPTRGPYFDNPLPPPMIQVTGRF